MPSREKVQKCDLFCIQSVSAEESAVQHERIKENTASEVKENTHSTLTSMLKKPMCAQTCTFALAVLGRTDGDK